ncbi:MAG: hypothetical protein KDA61_05945 [Planctomycetales bacterium]|nr:hypothetical protein [Planctomycetales bacterium]
MEKLKMPPQLLDEILSDAQAGAEASYRDLVGSLAEGERFAADEIRATVVNAGRTIEDLRRHVAAAEARKQAAADLARASELEDKLPELERALRDATTARNEAESKAERIYREQVEPAIQAVGSAHVALQEARREQGTIRRDAYAVLARTADPARVAALDDARNAMGELQRRANEAGVRRDLQSRLDLARGDLDAINRQDATFDPNATERRQRLEAAITNCEGRLATLDALEPQLADAERQVGEAEAALTTDWRSFRLD